MWYFVRNYIMYILRFEIRISNIVGTNFCKLHLATPNLLLKIWRNPYLLNNLLKLRKLFKNYRSAIFNGLLFTNSLLRTYFTIDIKQNSCRHLSHLFLDYLLTLELMEVWTIIFQLDIKRAHQSNLSRSGPNFLICQ